MIIQKHNIHLTTNSVVSTLLLRVPMEITNYGDYSMLLSLGFEPCKLHWRFSINVDNLMKLFTSWWGLSTLSLQQLGQFEKFTGYVLLYNIKCHAKSQRLTTIQCEKDLHKDLRHSTTISICLFVLVWNWQTSHVYFCIYELFSLSLFLYWFQWIPVLHLNNVLESVFSDM